MDKKTINIIIIVAVMIAIVAVIALKADKPDVQNGTSHQANSHASGAAQALPKIIKISAMSRPEGANARPCSPCGALIKRLAELQEQYPGRFAIETYYTSEKSGQALVDKYKIDTYSFVECPVQMIFLDSKGEKSETQLGLYASKAQIIEALKSVGVK